MPAVGYIGLYYWHDKIKVNNRGTIQMLEYEAQLYSKNKTKIKKQESWDEELR